MRCRGGSLRGSHLRACDIQRLRSRLQGRAMKTKKLGQAGVEISELGIGTAEYIGGPKPLLRALELGATFVDTAESYGTEYAIGEAFKGCRDRAFIASKVSAARHAYDKLIAAAEKSLERLKTDR